MGGGFRSIPPTGPLETTLDPKQVRHLPTPVVCLNPPDASARALVPVKGEKLQISGIDQWTDDTRTREALKRLGEAKAPQTISQMVLWYVTSGADWDNIGRLATGWGNAHEIALARRFVESLEKDDAAAHRVEPGRLYWDLKADGDQYGELIDGLRALWTKYPVLGLTAKEEIPERPEGPALACWMELKEGVLNVKLATSHPSGSDWVLLGAFRIKLSDCKPSPVEADRNGSAVTHEQRRECEAALLGDRVAAGLLERLVRVQLTRGPKTKQKDSFRIKIVNESSLILNSLALGGTEVQDDARPSALEGLSLPPKKSLAVPASAELVERLHLKSGVRVLAADLSGL
jgi:hypothetical protein